MGVVCAEPAAGKYRALFPAIENIVAHEEKKSIRKIRPDVIEAISGKSSVRCKSK
jgi:hypothetical protein